MDPDLTLTIERYLKRRKVLNHQRWSDTTNLQTRYLLHSWARYVGSDWREPKLDVVIDWATPDDVGPDYRHRRICGLRAFYKHLGAWGWEGVSAGLTVDWPSIPGGDEEPRPIPDDVYRKALMTGDEVDRRALMLGRLAGLRASEIAAVHTRDLDGDHLRVLGKGRRRRRVAAHPEVARIVREAHGYVFPADGGGHWRPGSISARLSDALPVGWTAHTLRHAFATQLYEETGDLLLVARQLGHMSTRTTQRYVQTRDERAVDVITRWAA